MNTPSFYPTKQSWDVKYTAENFANASALNACCKHVGNKCDPCPPGAVTVMKEDVVTNKQGHIEFSIARSSGPDLDGSTAAAEVVTGAPVAALVLPMEILVNATSGLPRFVVGQVVVGGRLQHVTFDAGNPKASILTAAGCLGCGDGCPHAVPSCAAPGSKFCSPSYPQEYVPASAYTVNASRTCAGANAGTLDGSPVCQQCFDGGNHARFYHLATADVSVVASTGPVTFKSMDFGALVRVTPLQDRLWGNIGLGYGSDFLKLTGATSIGLHLRPTGKSSVTLNPDPSQFQGWDSAPFGVTSNRDFVMAVSLGFEQCGSATFRIDTGNQGVSIADETIAAALATNAQGQWMSDGGLQVPSASWWQPPDLHFTLGTIRVTIPGHKWVLKGGKTIFVRYHKNVLGLPFIAAGDFYFADAAKTVYFNAVA